MVQTQGENIKLKYILPVYQRGADFLPANVPNILAVSPDALNNIRMKQKHSVRIVANYHSVNTNTVTQVAN